MEAKDAAGKPTAEDSIIQSNNAKTQLSFQRNWIQKEHFEIATNR